MVYADKKPEVSKLQALHSDPASILFLDIETTGLSHYYDQITLLGWSIGGSYEVALPWDSTDRLRDALAQASVLVTFNGTLFDLRFLRRDHPDVALPSFHIDLRYLARRAKLVGGQKVIERTLGIDLRQGLEEVDGRMAVIVPRLASVSNCHAVGFSGRISAGKTTASKLLENRGLAYLSTSSGRGIPSLAKESDLHSPEPARQC